MRLSVIVCTRNRSHTLGACLESIIQSLTCASPVEAEIVIVNNASEDNTDNIVFNFVEKSPFPIILLQEARKGLSNARNCGIRAARGDLLIFTDDDCRMQEDYILAAIKHDDADFEPVLRGGRVELGDPTDLPITIKTDGALRRWSLKLHSARYENLGNCFHGCNMLMRRGVAQIIGPFDERFGSKDIPAGEDTDYILRAYLNNLTIEYAPELVIYHYHGRKQLSEGRILWRNYMIASGALYAKFLFKDANLARQFYWDIKDSIKELCSKQKNYMSNLEFLYRDRVIYGIVGAFKYLFLSIKSFWLDYFRPQK